MTIKLMSNTNDVPCKDAGQKIVSDTCVSFTSLRPLILWSPKMPASKLTTQTSVFLADVCTVSIATSKT